MTIYEVAKCSAPLADMICHTYRSHRRVSDDTIDGAIRKAARENPEHAQTLLALLPGNQTRATPAPTVSRISGSDDEEELEEEEVDEMNGEEADWL